MQTQWINADESHPDYDVQVLVMVVGENPRYAVSAYKFGDGHFIWDGLGENDEVSYWTNLPPYPEKPTTFTILNKNQTEKLYCHLVEKFDHESSHFYLNAIVEDIQQYNEALNGSEKVYESAQYFSRSASNAYDLCRLCEKYPYLNKYQSNCWALAGQLQSFAKDSLNDEIEGNKRRGRPATTKYRNTLIKNIYGYYNKNEKGLKVENSHFEKTIEIVLNMIEYQPPKDIHSTIIKALKLKNV